MQSKISTPVGVSLVVVALLLVGFIFWKSQVRTVNLDEKGIPRTDMNPETKAGFDAMKSIPAGGQGGQSAAGSPYGNVKPGGAGTGN